MVIESSYGLVLWAVPRFRRVNSYSRSPLVTPPPRKAATVDRTEEIPQNSAVILTIEPEDGACLARQH